MRTIARLTLLVILLVPLTWADEEKDSLSGSIEIGYRDVNLEGNADKYREDLNLDDGALRLFGLDLAFRPESPGIFDELTLAATGLGGEPQASARLRMNKAGRYDLRADYRATDYFYRDAGYFFTESGDFHSWDANREFYRLGLKLLATDWLTFRLGADRTDRSGNSETTRHLQDDQFMLSRPVDQSASAYWLGTDIRLGWADLTLEQRFTSYENRWRLSSAASEGLEPGVAALDQYSVLQVQDADAPISSITFGGSPWDRLSFSLGYARIAAELDYEVAGDWEGDDYTDTPFQTQLTNTGRVERTNDLWDVEVNLSVLEELDLSFDFSRRSYEQDGTIDYLEEQVDGADQGSYSIEGSLRNELELDALRVGAQWRATEKLTLKAGVGVQNRNTDMELAGPPVETERTLYLAGIRYHAGPRLDLRLDLETGSDDNPYTQVSPTDLDRLSFRLRFLPREELRLEFHFKDESRANALAYPLGLPTDDAPPATEVSTAQFDMISWGLSVASPVGSKVDLSAGYSRAEIDADADLVYVTGYTLVPTFDIFTTLDRTGYTSEQEIIHGQAEFRLRQGWKVGLLAVMTNNDGTFPLDWNRYRAHARYQHESGLFVRLALERYELRESNPYAGDPGTPTPDVNDYDADLMTVALGYRF